MTYLSNLPPFSPATLVINLDNLRYNLDYFRNLISDQTRIMAMVKADAYGCGAVEVSKVLNSCGVQDFGVAYTQEGVELRKHGIKGSIMVMNPLPQDFLKMVHHQLEPELSHLTLLRKWVDFIRKEKIVDYPVHLELDTGMKRLGFTSEDIGPLCDVLKSSTKLKVKSLFSHLVSSSSPEDDGFTRSQFKRFEDWGATLNDFLVHPPDRHILNSAGIYRFSAHQYNMVRLGIGLYGAGMESLPIQEKLKPVQSLYASISQVKNTTRSETIGYERKGHLSSDGRIGVLNIGYADGLSRLAGNGRFSVRIGEEYCPILGSVCMDMTMVDLRPCPEAKPGSLVEIYGENNAVVHLAEAAQTISYEILTANHQRVFRRYLNL